MNSISTLLDFYLFYVYFLEKKKKTMEGFLSTVLNKWNSMSQ